MWLAPPPPDAMSAAHSRLPLLAVLVTAAGFFAVEYGVYVKVSRRAADLAGLVYLLASPVVYAAVRRALAAAPVLLADSTSAG